MISVTISQGDKKATFRLTEKEYGKLKYLATNGNVEEACMLAWGYFHLSKSKSKRFLKLFMGADYKQGDFTFEKKS